MFDPKSEPSFEPDQALWVTINSQLLTKSLPACAPSLTLGPCSNVFHVKKHDGLKKCVMVFLASVMGLLQISLYGVLAPRTLLTYICQVRREQGVRGTFTNQGLTKLISPKGKAGLLCMKAPLILWGSMVNFSKFYCQFSAPKKECL